MSSDPSPLVQGITWAVSIGVAVVTAIILGIKKAFKGEEKPAIKDGTKAELMMGAIIERNLITDLTAAVRALDGTMRETLELAREAREEAEIEQRVRERLNAELAKRGFHHDENR